MGVFWALGKINLGNMAGSKVECIWVELVPGVLMVLALLELGVASFVFSNRGLFSSLHKPCIYKTI